MSEPEKKKRKYKPSPYGKKPIPKAKIEWAIRNTLSIRAAANFLGVAYNTFKKHAKIYDLFEQNKNQSGKGIHSRGNTGWGVKIQDLFDGKHPNYPHWKLQERVIRDGYMKQECTNCGFDDYRQADMKGPYLLIFYDVDPHNHSLDNLGLLCYNCFFIIKPVGRLINSPKNMATLRKKLESVWEENKEE